MAQSEHIEKIFNKKSSKLIADNRMRLKASIDAIRWLTFQGCALRRHDEGIGFSNRDNLIELLKLLGFYNSNVDDVILEHAPKKAQYTAPSVQKEILHIFERRIRDYIWRESKYCIIIDEARDELKGKQMEIVLRFVDEEGQVQERFFDIVHVSNTLSSNLKNEITSVLSQNNLHVENIHGQGYHGASNVRGEWNGLKALFLKECPYAYYIHCFAHRLQLALVDAAKELSLVYGFFEDLTFIVNIVAASSKRHDQLQEAQASLTPDLIDFNELETSRGLNQIGTLQRVGDTRWSSHFVSIRSLLRMYVATYSVLETIGREGNSSQRGEAKKALDYMSSFNFVFILHLMRDILEITHDLCQALQLKCQDILNALSLVSTTKILLQKKRKTGWESFFTEVMSFCEEHTIGIPNMSALYRYKSMKGRPLNKESISVAHYYRINLFVATIDTRWTELTRRFSENSMELLTLIPTFDPKIILSCLM